MVYVYFEVLYSSNCLDGLKQITKNPSYKSWCPNWDLDSEFPKHKSEVLMHDLTSFAGDMVVNAVVLRKAVQFWNFMKYHIQISFRIWQCTGLRIQMM
jgi:hypothetical protein